MLGIRHRFRTVQNPSIFAAFFFITREDISHPGTTDELVKSLIRGNQDIIPCLVAAGVLFIRHGLEMDAVDLLVVWQHVDLLDAEGLGVAWEVWG